MYKEVKKSESEYFGFLAKERKAAKKGRRLATYQYYISFALSRCCYIIFSGSVTKMAFFS